MKSISIGKQSINDGNRLTELSKRIEVNSDKIEEVMNSLKALYLKAETDKDEIRKREEEYQRATDKLESDFLEYERLAWQELRKY